MDREAGRHAQRLPSCTKHKLSTSQNPLTSCLGVLELKATHPHHFYLFVYVMEVTSDDTAALAMLELSTIITDIFVRRTLDSKPDLHIHRLLVLEINHSCAPKVAFGHSAAPTHPSWQ